ncbi:12644_t:CDS:2 [Entrophospora sp. SA101]|nr:12644_t:CDS:2 [Entrophospora sp. SA101]CAJ0831585.1 10930_t:CDS:2 [Entrophospora sp. SA101]CAJ0916849.1 14235_t:CDS:2 [Entrophospora sp. SA101]
MKSVNSICKQSFNNRYETDNALLLKKLQNGLEIFARSLYQRLDNKRFFVTEQHNRMMKKIAVLDVKSLEEVVIKFVTKCKLNYTEIRKKNDIVNLQNRLTEELNQTWTQIALFDHIDSDDNINGRFKKSHLEKIETNPWVTPDHTSTDIPQEYQQYLQKLPFISIYEILRILKPLGPIVPDNSIWENIKTRCRGFRLSEYFREICLLYFNSQNGDKFPNIGELLPRNQNVWKLWEKEQLGVNSSSILFSAKVVPSKSKLILFLNPPKIGGSKRYYRLYSSNRFLHVHVETDKVDKELQSQLLYPLNLFGRKYELLYAKDGLFYYFATSGPGLKPQTIWEVIDFNIPIELNYDLTVPKFYSRMSLGFSNTKPTIIFKPNEIHYDVDDITKDGHCLTDGCAAISWAAMKKIATILGCEETPSAVQGRIGGSKGVWYLNPTHDANNHDLWIKLRKSQIKYKLRPHSVGNNDEHLRTFEVIHIITAPRIPGLLNTQFIRVLGNGGTKANVKRLNERCITKDSNDISSVITSEDDLTTFESELKELSGMPDSIHEQCVQMLHAGFTPSTCSFLAKKLTEVLSYTIDPLLNKYKIEVALSRTLVCIADPTGTLQPGEVYIQLDRNAGIDPRTGLPFYVIEGDVILARNPCSLPSDILKAKAVRNPHLNNYYNLVVFPTNVNPRESSMANNLSGGDYDGDKLILDIHFKDRENPLGLYDRFHRIYSNKHGISNPKSVYFSQMFAQLVDATKQGLNLKHGVLQADQNSIYQLPVPKWMGNDDSLKKGGEEGDAEANEDEVHHKSVMDMLYMTIEEEKRIIGSKDFSVVSNQVDSMDPHIRLFWIREIEHSKKVNDGGAYSSDLLLIERFTRKLLQDYNSGYSKKINGEKEDPTATESTSTTKKTSSSKNKNQKSFNYKNGPRDFSIDYEFLSRFISNPPLEQYKSDRLRYTSRENFGNPHAIFELQLKSCALYMNTFFKKKTGQCCWMLAFRSLCNVKAMMVESERSSVLGGPRFVIDDVWNSLKVDKKWAEKDSENNHDNIDNDGILY